MKRSTFAYSCGTEADRVVLHVESGRYRFESTGGIRPAKAAL